VDSVRHSWLDYTRRTAEGVNRNVVGRRIVRRPAKSPPYFLLPGNDTINPLCPPLLGEATAKAGGTPLILGRVSDQFPRQETLSCPPLRPNGFEPSVEPRRASSRAFPTAGRALKIRLRRRGPSALSATNHSPFPIEDPPQEERGKGGDSEGFDHRGRVAMCPYRRRNTGRWHRGAPGLLASPPVCPKMASQSGDRRILCPWGEHSVRQTEEDGPVHHRP
jgi:hypothetical protein